jgi:aminocarboxymuconate-semialdehyde decarboxylase
VERRLRDMDDDGVAIQVLSPMPELLSYWFDAADGERICDDVNAAIAEMVARAPARFRGLGMAPLQDPRSAERYIASMPQRFGLSGIEIGSNVNGRLPGNDEFEPVWAACEAAGLGVFVHALHPIATKSLAYGPAFTASVGFPLDVALAGASLVMKGVLARHPRLRIALSHGGGALATIAPRLDQVWRSFQAVRDVCPVQPSVQLRSLFYDSNVYDAVLLRHLATAFAPGQMCVGTDYPYPIMQTDPVAYVESADLDGRALASLRGEAALRFIGEG